jgi:uncharacterized protein
VAITKRTPCVGICSTTYGDLVCRGCKRFAHEIVQWNGYDAEQQATIWQRLLQLRGEVVEQYLTVADSQRFTEAWRQTKPAKTTDKAVAEVAEVGPTGATPDKMYEVTRHLVAASAPLTQGGLQANVSLEAEVGALEVLQAIDAEVYARSLAHYERNFKIPV